MLNIGRTSGVDGFTLVELMVVVAIIGVLASVAINSYTSMTARARQTEAKIALSAVYTSQKSYATESTSYSACLSQIGYAPDGNRRYYAVGFRDSASGNSFCGPDGNAPCNCISWNGAACDIPACVIGEGMTMFSATVKANEAAGLPTEGVLGSVLAGNVFSAGAVGSISSAMPAVYDYWTINQDKNLRNPIPGL